MDGADASQVDRLNLAMGSRSAKDGADTEFANAVNQLRTGKTRAMLSVLQNAENLAGLDQKWSELLLGFAAQSPDVSAVLLHAVGHSDIHYLSRLGKGVLVSVDEANRVELRRAVDVSTFIGEIVGPFKITSAAPPSPVSVLLSAPGLFALCCAIDRVRLCLAASLVQREPIGVLSFNLEQLYEQVTGAVKSPDNRWLTVIAKRLEGEISVDTAALREGMTELQQRGLVEELRGELSHWAPNTPLIDLASRLTHPTPALVLQAGEAGLKAQIAPSLSLVAGASLTRIVDLGREGQERFHVSGIDGLEVITEMLAYLEPCCGFKIKRNDGDEAIASTANQSAEINPEKTSRCAACNTTRNPQQKFCTNCGALF